MYYSDPDLLWIPEAVEQYGRSRATLDRLIDAGNIHPVEFLGDRRIFLRRSELDEVLGKPVRDVPGRGDGTPRRTAQPGEHQEAKR